MYRPARRGLGLWGGKALRRVERRDRLVTQMEGGQLPLDQLLDGYRRGAELLAYCRGRLQAVEEQVKVLDDGQLKAWSAE